MAEIKTIGVLTSGGDAPGMNAAIRSIVRSAVYYGVRVFGIRKGYNGLMEGDMVELNMRSVSDRIQHGGTMLYTARCPEFKEEAGMQKGIEVCRRFGIDGLIVIGGDGSFRGARDLSVRGLPCIGIPGTIDNDIVCTDYTIGFDTACNIAMEAVDRLRDTTQSHHRCSVVEVMGAHAGHIALTVGVATGAIAVVVPEKDLGADEVIRRIRAASATGKTHHIVIVAEGVKGGGAQIANQLKDGMPEIETRLTILGHIQRGGSPTVRDRVNATMMGIHALELVKEGIGNRIVGIKNSHVYDIDIVEGLAMRKTIAPELYRVSLIVSQ